MNLFDHFVFSAPTLEKWAQMLIVLLCVVAIRIILIQVLRKRKKDLRDIYHHQRIILYMTTASAVALVGWIWIDDVTSLTTFLGITSAGLAISMHDTVANLAGWLFIVFRRPFTVGDRIEIGGHSGDVIDMRVFQFSMIETGNWVDADQSTGRIIHVPNSKVLREPLANYEIGFDYIWNEIPVLITFESNWEKAKVMLMKIADEQAGHLSEGAQEQIRKASKKYLVFYRTLTPTVYTSVRDSGVLLTIRYIVKPRQRRSTEQALWEAILRAFANEPTIDLAYPTTRFYKLGEEQHQME